MKRAFQKISYDNLLRDLVPYLLQGDIESAYESMILPTRATKNSAGYDIRAFGSYKIRPHDTLEIPTGLKVKMPKDEVLLLFIRSSLASKQHLSLSNGVSVIDSDYYNNEDNEGHFYITLRNNSDETVQIKHGDRLCQGIFIKYQTTDNDKTKSTRSGGFGSTGLS